MSLNNNNNNKNTLVCREIVELWSEMWLKVLMTQLCHNSATNGFV